MDADSCPPTRPWRNGSANSVLGRPLAAVKRAPPPRRRSPRKDGANGRGTVITVILAGQGLTRAARNSLFSRQPLGLEGAVELFVSQNVGQRDAKLTAYLFKRQLFRGQLTPHFILPHAPTPRQLGHRQGAAAVGRRSVWLSFHRRHVAASAQESILHSVGCPGSNVVSRRNAHSGGSRCSTPLPTQRWR